jgi:hypothetical protein
MKFTLKDYQDEAVHDVLANLKKARKRWHEDQDKHAFSLTAATGAGKTVMAAQALEALFHGENQKFDFDRDPGAVVIWFSDDPSLNEQTRFRLMEASDRLRQTDLKVVEHPFSLPKFEAGKIYFLNTQKLGKNSLLVRGFEGDDDLLARPDAQAFTIWDTIRNTVEDPALTLYLVLDEAHRGMGRESRERSTIVQRLINGGNGVPGIPVVWGISATIERFNQAIAGMQGRSTLPPVTVDAGRVQASGLLKDTIVLDIPDEAGRFDTVLLGRATDKLREASTEWAAYAERQGDGVAVQPLMLLQLPNTPSPKLVGQWLDTIFQHWPGLSGTSVAHVLGEHTTQAFGPYKVPYVSPERVQDDSSIRILLAKDAISTGWDCPRAEVMVSFRPASDPTHIAQLLGRMVRTPLARRIPGNDRLNSVDCLLPYFDRTAVERVVASLRDGSDDTPPTGRILINPVEMKPNPDVPDSIWGKFTSLPSQTRPQRGAKPAVRLTALAHELASDGLLPGAGAKAHEAMHTVLDNFIRAREPEFNQKRKSVLTVEGRTVLAELHGTHIHEDRFEMDADDAVVGDAFRRSARILSPDIARTYTVARAKRREAEDFDDALIEAREEAAALHLMENLQIVFDSEAAKLADAWLAEYKDRIKQLPDERQEAYRQVIALSAEAQDVDLALPTSRFEPTVVRDRDGNETKIRLYPRHLLCDAKGLYPAELNPLERRVLDIESSREGFRSWYRNPDRASQDSLGIAYRVGEDSKILRPDFVFLAEQNGRIVADIIDPHGIHLADALPKLRGLAIYAAEHPQDYRRIEAVAEVGGRLRRLDMTRLDVREAVAGATGAESLYAGEIGGDYG